jgi:hypothetical protein
MNTQLHETGETEPPIERANDDEPSGDRRELAARIAVLEAENRTLRTEYAHAHRVTYRWTALSLAAIGLAALLGGLLFPADRAVFVVLGAIGLFGGALTYHLTPEQVVPAAVGERVYTTLSSNLASIAADLGLRDDAVYVPGRGDRSRSVRLFVPLVRDYRLPSLDAGPLVIDGDERGLLLKPTGAALYREFERGRTVPQAETPDALATQLCDALVEQFEFAESALSAVDAADGRVTVAVTGSTFGDVDRFDNPVSSFLAVGLAVGLGEPVTVDVARGDDRAEWFVTCRYPSE